MIHRIIREFLQFREGKGFSVEKQHADLYVHLKSVKGIGPLSFNQLWHSLYLSGVLPHEYTEYSTISSTAGPAKLIQVFHGKKVNSTSKLLKVLSDVRAELRKLGFGKVTDFFLENMLCELWRITTARKLCTKTMIAEELSDFILGDSFQSYVKDSSVTSYPDIYFRNPFNNDYQHLFCVSSKVMFMWPSFMENVVERSVQFLQCAVEYNEESCCVVQWKGDCLKRIVSSPANLFIKERQMN
jgi:hypothetical protein